MSDLVKLGIEEPQGSGTDGDKGVPRIAKTSGIKEFTEALRKKMDKATMDSNKDMDMS